MTSTATNSQAAAKAPASSLILNTAELPSDLSRAHSLMIRLSTQAMSYLGILTTQQAPKHYRIGTAEQIGLEKIHAACIDLAERISFFKAVVKANPKLGKIENASGGIERWIETPGTDGALLKQVKSFIGDFDRQKEQYKHQGIELYAQLAITRDVNWPFIPEHGYSASLTPFIQTLMWASHSDNQYIDTQLARRVINHVISRTTVAEQSELINQAIPLLGEESNRAAISAKYDECRTKFSELSQQDNLSLPPHNLTDSGAQVLSQQEVQRETTAPPPLLIESLGKAEKAPTSATPSTSTPAEKLVTNLATPLEPLVRSLEGRIFDKTQADAYLRAAEGRLATVAADALEGVLQKERQELHWRNYTLESAQTGHCQSKIQSKLHTPHLIGIEGQKRISNDLADALLERAKSCGLAAEVSHEKMWQQLRNMPLMNPGFLTGGREQLNFLAARDSFNRLLATKIRDYQPKPAPSVWQRVRRNNPDIEPCKEAQAQIYKTLCENGYEPEAASSELPDVDEGVGSVQVVSRTDEEVVVDVTIPVTGKQLRDAGVPITNVRSPVPESPTETPAAGTPITTTKSAEEFPPFTPEPPPRIEPARSEADIVTIGTNGIIAGNSESASRQEPSPHNQGIRSLLPPAWSKDLLKDQEVRINPTMSYRLEGRRIVLSCEKLLGNGSAQFELDPHTVNLSSKEALENNLRALASDFNKDQGKALLQRLLADHQLARLENIKAEKIALAIERVTTGAVLRNLDLSEKSVLLINGRAGLVVENLKAQNCALQIEGKDIHLIAPQIDGFSVLRGNFRGASISGDYRLACYAADADFRGAKFEGSTAVLKQRLAGMHLHFDRVDRSLFDEKIAKELSKEMLQKLVENLNNHFESQDFETAIAQLNLPQFNAKNIQTTANNESAKIGVVAKPQVVSYRVLSWGSETTPRLEVHIPQRNGTTPVAALPSQVTVRKQSEDSREGILTAAQPEMEETHLHHLAFLRGLDEWTRRRRRSRVFLDVAETESAAV